MFNSVNKISFYCITAKVPSNMGEKLEDTLIIISIWSSLLFGHTLIFDFAISMKDTTLKFRIYNSKSMIIRLPY